MNYPMQKQYIPQTSLGVSSISSMVQGALALHKAGRLEDAKKQYKKILKHDPKNIHVLNLIGVLAAELRKPNIALNYLDKAIKLAPEFSEALNNRGLIKQDLACHEEALKDFNQALSLNQLSVDALYNRGNLFLNNSEFESAKDDFSSVLALDPVHAQALAGRGLAFKGMKLYEQAKLDFDKAISINLNDYKSLNNRGNVLKEMGRAKEALLDFDMSISLAPTLIEAHNNKGSALLKLKQHEAALISFNKALELDPKFSTALNNRGVTLIGLDRFDEAIADFSSVLWLEPKNVVALKNLGAVYETLKMPSKAMEAYDRAISIDPSYADAHFNKSLVLLRMGNFEAGWPLYEWRNHRDRKHRFSSPVRNFLQPLWLGDADVRDKTVFLYWEQGLGDTIQFSRLAEQVSKLGCKVILEVQEPLKDLMLGLNGVEEIIQPGESVPDFDYHCPLMSLPYALNLQPHNIPSTVPYLTPNQSKVDYWRDKLGPENKPRIGVVWSGSKSHQNDTNRSVRLSHLLENITATDVFYSLQKEMRPEDLDYFDSQERLYHFGHELNDFSDTAALTELMDVVISVDTSVAHLAGAMGKIVFLLLPYESDFRWLEGVAKSPWYPTITLFRQDRNRDWYSVFQAVNQMLVERLIEPL